MITILVGTYPLLLESIERGYYIGEQGIFTFPDWPMKAMVVLGSLAALLCFIVRAVLHWRVSAPVDRATADAPWNPSASASFHSSSSSC